MVYEIQVPPQMDVPSDLDLVYDNPKSAKADLDYLRRRFPEADLVISKDGVQLTESELVADVKSYEIQSVRDEATRIPATYRRGRGTESDDAFPGSLAVLLAAVSSLRRSIRQTSSL